LVGPVKPIEFNQRMSARVYDIVSYVAMSLAFGALAVWSIRKSEDPARTAFKWGLTFVLVICVYWKVFPMADQGGLATFIAMAICMVAGLVLFITWRQEIGALVAKPFTSLYDGGDVPPEPRPFYSIARARQKQAKYVEAVAEIQKQLGRFPTDFEGQMFLAEVQAEGLKDLDATEVTILNLCAQPGHAPKNLAYALYSLADWHLKYQQDAGAARRALEQIIALLPETEFALTAAQRIAHLTDPQNASSNHEPRKFVVKEGVRNLGLAKNPHQFVPTDTDPSKTAAECVKHLEQHPLDTDARERLAVIYADHYHRLDLATDQLEQMIQLPNQPPKQVVRWLNQLADLQVREGLDYESVKQTLQRVVTLDPKLAAAETAGKRIALLKLELKAKQQNQSVKMGTYEQNLGLKHARGPYVPPG
jgi:tetratricopeptide (TPR) repeat protein